MEAEWEEYIISINSLIPGIEVAFRHWEGVSQMQKTIHVGIWEGLKKFGFLIGFYGEVLISVPDFSGSLF